MILWTALALILCSGLFVTWLVVKAPEGYEDEKGFHYGKPPEDEP